jgi:hypothetical protein
MPVEIRELVIRATVEPGVGEQKTPAKQKGGGEAHAEMIAEIVEQVLEILRKERER